MVMGLGECPAKHATLTKSCVYLFLTCTGCCRPGTSGRGWQTVISSDRAELRTRKARAAAEAANGTLDPTTVATEARIYYDKVMRRVVKRPKKILQHQLYPSLGTYTISVFGQMWDMQTRMKRNGSLPTMLCSSMGLPKMTGRCVSQG